MIGHLHNLVLFFFWKVKESRKHLVLVFARMKSSNETPGNMWVVVPSLPTSYIFFFDQILFFPCWYNIVIHPNYILFDVTSDLTYTFLFRNTTNHAGMQDYLSFSRWQVPSVPFQSDHNGQGKHLFTVLIGWMTGLFVNLLLDIWVRYTHLRDSGHIQILQKTLERGLILLLSLVI